VPNDSSSSLRDVVEATLAVTFLGLPDGRDAVVSLLRPELVSLIPRMPTITRLDMMGIVTACARYGALSELVEAIRFYAADTAAMARLDVVMAQRQASLG